LKGEFSIAGLRPRRRFLARAASLFTLPLWFTLPGRARAQLPLDVVSVVPAIRDFTKGAEIHRGRIKLDLPRLADNGNSVALKVYVAGTVSATEYVRSIQIFSEMNPRPVIARFFLGPHAGKAEITSRIRLAGTQRVVAVAELSDGSFWSDVAEVAVTLSACYDAA
jgi:sulfur-oxidizing protein SoxY